MTDNKLWDTIIEPSMNVNLVPIDNGRIRGIRMSFITTNGFLVEVEENGTNNIGTNFKKARQNLINKVRQTMKREIIN